MKKKLYTYVHSFIYLVQTKAHGRHYKRKERKIIEFEYIAHNEINIFILTVY